MDVLNMRSVRPRRNAKRTQFASRGGIPWRMLSQLAFRPSGV